MKIKIFCWVILILGLAQSVFCANPNFPFRGKITSDSVNVRAGYNKNFEILAKLKQDEIVTVLEEKYGWFKILLPNDATCYISAQYIEQFEPAKAKITVNRLNIRALPDDRSAIIGQLHKDDLIEIREISNNWVRFIPNSACSGWVGQEFIKFLDNNANIEPVAKFVEITQPVQAQPEEITLNLDLVLAKGILKKPWGSLQNTYPYKMMSDSGKIYYLQFNSNQAVCTDYHNRQAEVSGEKSDPYKTYDVLKVRELRVLKD